MSSASSAHISVPDRDGERGGGSEPGGPATAASEAPADAIVLWIVALRDLALALVALSLWAAADAWYAVTGIGFAAGLAVANGLLVGGVLTFLAHEWGHFAGARGSGGTAPLKPVTSVFPLFEFDFERSEVQHFQAMSIGGNVTPWLLGLLFLILLPLDTPGRVALVSAAFGFAVFAARVEIPVIRRVVNGMDPQEALGRILPEGGIRKGALAGVVTAAVLFIVL